MISLSKFSFFIFFYYEHSSAKRFLFYHEEKDKQLSVIIGYSTILNYIIFIIWKRILSVHGHKYFYDAYNV
jgi:hypothetical protein